MGPMPTPRRTLAVAADPLGEALHLVQLTGTLYCRGELGAPWGIHVPSLPDLITFQVVLEGSAWLELEGREPLLLQRGSLTVIPHGTPHRLVSAPGLEAAPLFSLPVEQVSDRYEILRHGGDGARTSMMYGAVRFDGLAGERLVQHLPELLHVTRWEGAEEWLEATFHLIAREAKTMRPGGETVLTRLADVILVQAIRAWLDSAPEAHTGWLLALRDEKIGRALLLMHRAPERAWTVASLADAIGMSRSAFSARFTELVGTSALRYLTEWRLQLARRALPQSDEPLFALATRFGYASEAAFSRAFSRQFGTAPGRVRKGLDS